MARSAQRYTRLGGQESVLTLRMSDKRGKANVSAISSPARSVGGRGEEWEGEGTESSGTLRRTVGRAEEGRFMEDGAE